ncbi:MAG: hypothetical protein JJT89_12160 [Nitriliruptoraceae bacterium]|nr:hypothetical protein [Nitriliruptoraceae bacterium]
MSTPDPDPIPGQPTDAAGPAPRSIGQRLVRAVALLVLIAIAIVVLFLWVFPWVEERTQDPTLGGAEVVQASLAPR